MNLGCRLTLGEPRAINEIEYLLSKLERNLKKMMMKVVGKKPP
jgi:hypothetical protein